MKPHKAKCPWQEAYMEAWEDILLKREEWKTAQPNTHVQKSIKIAATLAFYRALEIMEKHMPKAQAKRGKS